MKSFFCLRQAVSFALVISVLSEEQSRRPDNSLRHASAPQRVGASGGRRELYLDQLPPSSELWCSFLNFCVEDSTLADTPVPPSPTTAPESTVNALCTFLRLCDATTAPSSTPTPAPAPNSNELTTTNQGIDLLDVCVYIGLCLEPSPTIAPSAQPTVTSLPPTEAPTFPGPPQWDSVCEFLGNCPTKPTTEPTSRPTEISAPSPKPTQEPTSPPALENDTAVDFLCSILGWCSDVSDETTPAPTFAVSTLRPTPAPTRPTLLCLVSRIC